MINRMDIYVVTLLQKSINCTIANSKELGISLPSHEQRRMASRKQVLEFFFIACLLLLCFVFQSHATTEINPDGLNSSAASDSADKVTLSLYYESLCPYCANFIVNELVKVFETDLVSVVNLRLVPWGNTQITPNKSWICQHGRDECLLDMVEACAINAWPHPEMHFKFIRCVEDLRLKNMHDQWRSCFGSLGLSETPIRNCFNTGLAVRLEQSYADETAHLNPPHRFVPWVLVNDIPLQEDYQSYVAHICRSYRGNNVPQACKLQAFDEFNSFRAVNSSQVCNAGNAKNITSLAPSSKNRSGKKLA